MTRIDSDILGKTRIGSIGAGRLGHTSRLLRSRLVRGPARREPGRPAGAAARPPRPGWSSLDVAEGPGSAVCL